MNNHKFRHKILACGAESKGVYALAKGRKLFVSKEFGNLSDFDNLSRFQRSLKGSLKRFSVKPDIIACDMHPDYNSTSLAKELRSKDTRLIETQHHHAHIASSMADNNIKGRVIGVAFDGTGYGADGNIWGGEFLISSFRNFKRRAHFKNLPMPGGDMAVREPWRMAAAYLRDCFGDDFLYLDIPFTRMIKKRDYAILRYMVDRKINSPLTSSAGRLFDAVASMVTGIFTVRYEAEAAIGLERSAQRVREERRYRSDIIERDKNFIIDPKGMVREIVRDIKLKISTPVIAARFHNTLANMIKDICIRLRDESGINRVVFTGGVFQNGLLTKKAQYILRALKFRVYMHKDVPTSDAGISIGQAMIADARCRRCA